MIRRALLSLSIFALAACSSEPAAEQEGADDFAKRIGQAEGGPAKTELDPAQPDANAPSAAQAIPPAGAKLTQLQQLGDIGGVNLGPREGGCTFMSGGQEMLIAAALNDHAIPGRAVVRVGDALVQLSSGIGGLEAIKRGTTFKGEGFTIAVSTSNTAAETRPARVIVTDAAGKSQDYSGNWICA